MATESRPKRKRKEDRGIHRPAAKSFGYLQNTEINTREFLEKVRDYPHLLGPLVGMTKGAELHSEWIWECWGAPEHYVHQAHRGSYKTTFITMVGMMWWWLFNPSDRVALIRGNWTESAKTLATVGKWMRTEPIRQLFTMAHGVPPRSLVRRAGSLLYNFKGTITKENSADAYGIDQVPTGSHYDKIVCDDIITLQDRLSQARRERTKEGIREILTNIIDPGKQVIITGTPWHKEDGFSILPAPSKYALTDTGLLTPEQIANKKATTTPSLWAANYELRHEAEGDLLFADMKFAPWVPHKHAKITAHLDAKFGGTDTNALTFATLRPDGKILVHGKVFHEHIAEKANWVRNYIFARNNNRITTVYNESNPDKGFVAGLLAIPQGAKGHALDVVSYHESTNKHHKIVTQVCYFWDRLLFDPESDEEYLAQISDYKERATPDDAPDSLASLLRAVYYPVDEANPDNDMALYT